ncbi:hypothetical protein [Thermococcus celer]|uniref:Uncharacterized protein n=1 Tax=Thermococcus celer Vu 13 = JCM 8558 TaxID=1293037 RepID=A0A218P3A2_THECE|nr:hypothetical protein [Thermococcus celer]ASI99402.1 hypothetical protein A3L02_07460 [Thermococcus celer Vu 13 = JCM 8558]
MVKIKQGDIIHAPFLSEKLKVITTMPVGDNVVILGKYINSKNLAEVVITPDMLTKITVIKNLLDFQADPH